MWVREQTGGNIRGFQGTGAEEESERHSLTAEGRREEWTLGDLSSTREREQGDSKQRCWKGVTPGGQGGMNLGKLTYRGEHGEERCRMGTASSEVPGERWRRQRSG